MNLHKKLLLILFLFTSSLIQAQSYKKLHSKSIVADTHNDVLSTVTMRGLNIEDDLLGKTHSDLARFKKGGVDVQVFLSFEPFAFKFLTQRNAKEETQRAQSFMPYVRHF